MESGSNQVGYERAQRNGGHAAVARRDQEGEPRFFVPRADIIEDKEAIRIFLDMPGVTPEQLEVSLEKSTLTVEGRVQTTSPKNMDLAYREYREAGYRRLFTISDEIRRDDISATAKNGVVEIVLPKAEEVKPKKISVRSA